MSYLSYGSEVAWRHHVEATCVASCMPAAFCDRAQVLREEVVPASAAWLSQTARGFGLMLLWGTCRTCSTRGWACADNATWQCWSRSSLRMLIFTCVVGLPMRVIHMGRRVFIFVSTSVVADAWRPENPPQELQRSFTWSSGSTSPSLADYSDFASIVVRKASGSFPRAGARACCCSCDS